MNKARFLTRHLWLMALLLFIAACAPVRQGVSWADLTVIGEDQQTILVSYNNYMVMVDSNGRAIPLRNAQGEIRTGDDGSPRRWEVAGGDTNSQFFATPIWLDDETLLAADYNSKLVRVNLNRADVQPGSEMEISGHVITDPIQIETWIIVGFTDQDIAAYDINTRAEVWRYETERGIWGDPLLIDEIIYAASMDHHLYAVDSRSGNEVWKLDTEGAIASAPLYNDEHFYVGTFGRRILDISMNGEILAEYQTEDWVWSTPVLENGILYATDLSGHVYALNAETGLTEVWKSRPSEKGIRPRPLVTGDFVIVADRDGNLFWLNRSDGTIIEEYTQDVGAEILSDIILLERTEPLEPLVVVSTVKNDKVLVAFTLDAVPTWTYGR